MRRPGTALGSLAIVLALAQPAFARPGRTFHTPEAAVTHFVNSVAADDLDGALEAFAIDEYAARFDFAATAREMGTFTAPFMDGPSRYKMYVRINALKAAAEAASQAMLFIGSFLLDDAAFESLRHPTGPSDAGIQAVTRALDPAKLRALKIVRMDQPRKSVTTTPKATALARKQAVRRGAENSTDRIALFKLDGQYYWAGFHLLKYGKTWRILRLSSYYAEMSGAVPRNVAKTTLDEYVALTK